MCVQSTEKYAISMPLLVKMLQTAQQELKCHRCEAIMAYRKTVMESPVISATVL